MPLTVEQFTKRLADSGILPDKQLRDFIAGLPENSSARSNAEEMARELVREKKLTKYQAEQIYAGQGESLTLGNYVILDKLGQGGMGIVLKAEHKRMKRLVAIKVMSPAAVKTPDALKRFHREVEAAAKLRHTNIVAADDADEARGTHFLVMEYVEGSDLSAHVKKNGPFPVDQAVNCIIQAARGLEYAHKRGVVHRDIKPANLLLDCEGTVKILDMGLARIEGEIGAQAELTSTGAVMGTVDYMAPEQARNTKTADARSDIYSLGISLWYLLTGRPVFDGQTLTERLLAHQTDPIPSLTEAVTRVGRVSQAKQEEPSTIGIEARDFASSSEGRLAALDAVFRRMVAKKPGDRPQSMTEVIADLERCLVQGKPDFGSATVTFVSSEDSPRQVTASPTEVAIDSGLAETMLSAAGKSPLDVTLPHVPNSGGWDKSSKTRSINVADEIRGAKSPAVQADVLQSKEISTANGRSNRSSGGTSTSRRWIIIGAALACVVIGVSLTSFLNRGSRQTDPARNRGVSSRHLDGQNTHEVISDRTAVDQGQLSERRLNVSEREVAEWIINNGGKLDVESGQTRIGRIADLPGENLRIVAVTYEGKLNFSKADAESLARLPHLRSVLLFDSILTAGAIKPLTVSRSLRWLVISGGSSAPENFEEVLNLQQLDSLQLDRSQIDDRFVAKLGQLKRLRELQLFGNVNVTDAGVTRLCESAPPKLESLSFGGLKIGPECMEAISRLPHLQTLGFGGTELTDDVISELHRCQSLAKVSLTQEGVSKEAISELQTALDGCQFRVSNVDQASSLNGAPYREAIQHLVARGFQVALSTEKIGGISWLRNNTPFPPGDLVYAEGVEPDDPAVLELDQASVDDLVQLRDLQWLKLSKLPTGGLNSLLPLKNLTTIVIYQSLVSEVDCRQLRSFRKLRHIGLKFQNDESLKFVAELPHLSRLNIHRHSTLSNDCLKLLENSKNLSQLEVWDAIPHEAAHAFANARPDVIVYWNGGLIRPVTDPIQEIPTLAKTPFDAKQAREHQEEWARHLGTDVESTNSIGQKMVLLPPGEFLMGSSDEQVATALKAAADMKADRGVVSRIETSERPQHRVMISKPLRMSATEVTVGQFKRFVAASKYVTEAERYGFGDSAGTALNDKVTETQRQSNWRSPGYAVDDNSPVAQITWNDAVAYCKWLSDQEKITYRLPTEAEWEYACRAGTTTQYSFGDDYKALPKYGWPIENAVIQSHPVGKQLPNSFGLLDMHGNLYEWCSDYFEANWYAASPVSDPIGPISGSNRVLRGGSIHNGPSQCRSASRYSNSPSGRYKDYGFRCVAELQRSADASAKTQTFGSDEWIDVMPLLKPEVDKVDIGRALVGKNDWRIEDGELRYYGDDKSGKLYFPVRCLGRSLECEFEFTRTAGNISFNMDIPIPDGFVPLTIGSDRIGFVNESLTDKFVLVNGHRTKLRLRVTQVGADDRLEVFVNDQPLVDWKGALAKHKIVPPRTDARNPSEHFSLFAHGPTNYSFRAIRMRMLNGGSAKSLRPAAANAKLWIDWLGPKVKRGDFDVNPNGWVREGEAVTTEHVISGIEVLPPTTRDGAIRVTYLLRDAKGIAINARDHVMDNNSDFRELYVVEDLRDGLRIAYARAGQPDRPLTTQAIGADVSKDLPRTLEFRVVGDTLTVTLNGSLVSTVKDSTIPVGNFAFVALKGVLIQKVEYQSLD